MSVWKANNRFGIVNAYLSLDDILLYLGIISDKASIVAWDAFMEKLDSINGELK